MTLRRLVMFAGRHNARVGIVAGIQVARSLRQAEKATAQGLAEALIDWSGRYGEFTDYNMRRYLSDLGKMADDDLDNDMVIALLDPKDMGDGSEEIIYGD